MNFLKFLQKNDWWKRFLVIAVTLGVVGFFAQGVYQLYKKSTFIHEERQKKEETLKALVAERQRLESEIEFLKSQSAIEREAKSRLNFKKPGEEVVVVVPEEKPAEEMAPETESFFGSLLQFFRK
jgi:cell division protein FtsB